MNFTGRVVLGTSLVVLLALTVLFWSGNWVIGRAAVGAIPPVALAFWRWSLAVLFMLPFALPQIRRDWPAIRANWKAVLMLAVLGTGYHNLFSYLGLQYTTATNGVMLNSSIPVFIMALGWLFFGQRVSRLQLMGVGISLLGVLAIIARGDPAVLLQLQLNYGDLILLAAMMQWALHAGAEVASGGHFAAGFPVHLRQHRRHCHAAGLSVGTVRGEGDTVVACGDMGAALCWNISFFHRLYFLEPRRARGRSQCRRTFRAPHARIRQRAGVAVSR